MGRVVVTGGSGKAGRALIRDLLARGEDVLRLDLAPSDEVECEQLSGQQTLRGRAVDHELSHLVSEVVTYGRAADPDTP